MSREQEIAENFINGNLEDVETLLKGSKFPLSQTACVFIWLIDYSTQETADKFIKWVSRNAI